MKAEGCAVIIITHKINEVMEISDRITVLRRGKSIATVKTAETTPRELTEMMVGRPISLEIERANVEEGLKTPLLKVENLSVVSPDGVKRVDQMSFEMTRGEILGVAGIACSGQKELCEAIVGLCRASEGSVLFEGAEILGMTPRDIIRKGVSMSFIPEDRLGMGLVAGMDITDNVLLKAYQNMPGALVDRKEGRRMAERIIRKFGIVTSGVSQPVKNLSGGNIQKVLLGREIELSPSLLIAGYPVRGLDIGASYGVYDVLNEQKKKGVGILYIGEDLDVLLELCDRIMVISRGSIVDIVRAQDVTKEDIGLMMFGQHLDKGGADGCSES
jgi:simple sugar transport system ATP-binding protein